LFIYFNYNKPALTRVQQYNSPHRHIFKLCLVTLTFDMLIPKLIRFPDSWRTIFVSSKVIHRFLRYYSNKQTDKQTNAGVNPTNGIILSAWANI